MESSKWVSAYWNYENHGVFENRAVVKCSAVSDSYPDSEAYGSDAARLLWRAFTRDLRRKDDCSVAMDNGFSTAADVLVVGSVAAAC